MPQKNATVDSTPHVLLLAGATGATEATATHKMNTTAITTTTTISSSSSTSTSTSSSSSGANTTTNSSSSGSSSSRVMNTTTNSNNNNSSNSIISTNGTTTRTPTPTTTTTTTTTTPMNNISTTSNNNNSSSNSKSISNTTGNTHFTFCGSKTNTDTVNRKIELQHQNEFTTSSSCPSSSSSSSSSPPSFSSCCTSSSSPSSSSSSSCPSSASRYISGSGRLLVAAAAASLAGDDSDDVGVATTTTHTFGSGMMYGGGAATATAAAETATNAEATAATAAETATNAEPTAAEAPGGVVVVGGGGGGGALLLEEEEEEEEEKDKKSQKVPHKMGGGGGGGGGKKKTKKSEPKKREGNNSNKSGGGGGRHGGGGSSGTTTTAITTTTTTSGRRGGRGEGGEGGGGETSEATTAAEISFDDEVASSSRSTNSTSSSSSAFITATSTSRGTTTPTPTTTTSAVAETFSPTACAYCGANSPECVLRCCICDKYFCNSPSSAGSSSSMGSHIIFHLVRSRHKEVMLHPEGPLGDCMLECFQCGTRNIFLLGLIPAESEGVVVLICREPCLSSNALKQSGWDLSQWQPLIEGKAFLPWLVRPLTAKERKSCKTVSIQQLQRLEELWQRNPSATLAELDTIQKEEVLPVVKLMYEDGYDYQRTFAPLVQAEANYDKLMKEGQKLEKVQIRWELGLRRKRLAYFLFSRDEGCNIRLAAGDEVKITTVFPKSLLATGNTSASSSSSSSPTTTKTTITPFSSSSSSSSSLGPSSASSSATTTTTTTAPEKQRQGGGRGTCNSSTSAGTSTSTSSSSRTTTTTTSLSTFFQNLTSSSSSNSTSSSNSIGTITNTSTHNSFSGNTLYMYDTNNNNNIKGGKDSSSNNSSYYNTNTEGGGGDDDDDTNNTNAPYVWSCTGSITRFAEDSEEVVVELKKPPTGKGPWDMSVPLTYTIEFLWKSTSFERMQTALRQLAVDEISVSSYLYHTFMGRSLENQVVQVSMPTQICAPNLAPLNPSQMLAIRYALQHPLSLIQGPPGTGKTLTCSTLVYQMVKLSEAMANNNNNEYSSSSSCTSSRQNISLNKIGGGQVLVAAPSNIAVDQLAERIHRTGLKVVRVYSKSKEFSSSSSASAFCLEHLALHKNIHELQTSTSDEMAKYIKLKEHTGELAPADEKRLRQLVARAEMEILQTADVICTTCVGAGDNRLQGFRFRQVVIDEATQATEPECLIPIVLGAKQVVLIGDHCQLGPVILDKKVAAAGLATSLFSRLLALGHRPLRLKVQYRMHPALSFFPSYFFYEGELQNGVTVKDRTYAALQPGGGINTSSGSGNGSSGGSGSSSTTATINSSNSSNKMSAGSTIASGSSSSSNNNNTGFPWPSPERPMFFYHSSAAEEISGSGTSYINRVEATNIEKIVTFLLKCGLKASQIGVITPYDGQRAHITSLFQRHSTLGQSAFSDLEVASVDAFQGREKDFILLSCVRSNNTTGIGFLADARRLNVALTRARYGLIICGNAAVLANYSPPPQRPVQTRALTPPGGVGQLQQQEQQSVSSSSNSPGYGNVGMMMMTTTESSSSSHNKNIPSNMNSPPSGSGLLWGGGSSLLLPHHQQQQRQQQQQQTSCSSSMMMMMGGSTISANLSGSKKGSQVLWEPPPTGNTGASSSFSAIITRTTADRGGGGLGAIGVSPSPSAVTVTAADAASAISCVPEPPIWRLLIHHFLRYDLVVDGPLSNLKPTRIQVKLPPLSTYYGNPVYPGNLPQNALGRAINKTTADMKSRNTNKKESSTNSNKLKRKGTTRYEVTEEELQDYSRSLPQAYAIPPTAVAATAVVPSPGALFPSPACAALLSVERGFQPFPSSSSSFYSGWVSSQADNHMLMSNNNTNTNNNSSQGNVFGAHNSGADIIEGDYAYQATTEEDLAGHQQTHQQPWSPHHQQRRRQHMHHHHHQEKQQLQQQTISEQQHQQYMQHHSRHTYSRLADMASYYGAPAAALYPGANDTNISLGSSGRALTAATQQKHMNTATGATAVAAGAAAGAAAAAGDDAVEAAANQLHALNLGHTSNVDNYYNTVSNTEGGGVITPNISVRKSGGSLALDITADNYMSVGVREPPATATKQKRSTATRVPLQTLAANATATRTTRHDAQDDDSYTFVGSQVGF